jgi:DNA-binding GntR family transcriptional regulator
MAGKSNVDTKLLDAALQVDWHMHNLIVESMGNRILMTAHQQNFDKIKMIRLHGRSPRYLPLAMEEHLVVIGALKARDADQAAAALSHHLHCAEHRALGL